MEEFEGISSARRDALVLLKDTIRNSRNKNKNYSNVDLLPNSQTRKLLGRLLLNAGPGKAKTDAFSGTNNKYESTAGENIGGNLPVESQKIRQAVASAKLLVGLLEQIVDVLNIIIDSWKLRQDDVASILNAVRNDPSVPFSSNFGGSDVRVLYTVQIMFRNVGKSVTALKREVDNSGCISESCLAEATSQLCNSARALHRLLRSTAIRLAQPGFKESSDSCHYIRSLNDLLVQLSVHADALFCSVSSLGNTSTEWVNELLRKLRHAVSLFELHVLQTFEERRRLLHLLSELDLQNVVRESSAQKRRMQIGMPPQQRPRLVLYRPNFRPKGFLLPLPLARRRERLNNFRASEREQSSPQVASAERDRVLALERRLAQLEEQVAAGSTRRLRPYKQILDAAGVEASEKGQMLLSARPSGAPHLSQPLHHADDTQAGDLASSLLGVLPFPSNLSNRECRQIVQEALDELSEDISKLCDEITEDIFINEIQKATGSDAERHGRGH